MKLQHAHSGQNYTFEVSKAHFSVEKKGVQCTRGNQSKPGLLKMYIICNIFGEGFTAAPCRICFPFLQNCFGSGT